MLILAPTEQGSRMDGMNESGRWGDEGGRQGVGGRRQSREQSVVAWKSLTNRRSRIVQLYKLANDTNFTGHPVRTGCLVKGEG
jgi:hypothetical protein